MLTWTCNCCGVQAHRFMTVLAEKTGNGGVTWASENAVVPNVKVKITAAIAAIVISHGNGEWYVSDLSRGKQSREVTRTSGEKGRLQRDIVIVRC